MAANIALKRAKKAQKRKQQVAEKRKVEAFDASLPGQVQRAARAPIQHCLVTESLFETGMGMVILARGVTRHHVTFAAFTVDTFCHGIKDVTFASRDGDAFELFVDGMALSAPAAPAEPSYARKLLRDLAAWSRSIGFPPHRDFAAVERLFGDVDAEANDVIFRFGRDGEPFYISGPRDSPATVQRRLARLRTMYPDGEDGLESAA